MAFTRGSANKGTRDYVNTIFSAKIISKLDHQFGVMDCVNTDWEPEIANSGDLVTIPKVGADAAWQSYNPDVTSITYRSLTEDSVDLVIDQFKYDAFKLDYIDEQQSYIDAAEMGAERVGITGRETVEAHLLTGLQASAEAANIIGAATAGSVVQLTPDNVHHVLTDAYTLLSESKAFGATEQTPWLLVPPRVVGVMKKSGQATQATAQGDETVRKGVLFEFAGFHIKQVTNLGLTPASGGNDAHFAVMAGVNLAYTFAMQTNLTEDIVLESQFGKGFRALMAYGSVAVNPGGLVKLICNV